LLQVNTVFTAFNSPRVDSDDKSIVGRVFTGGQPQSAPKLFWFCASLLVAAKVKTAAKLNNFDTVFFIVFGLNN
jgi:hypothetical protein